MFLQLIKETSYINYYQPNQNTNEKALPKLETYFECTSISPTKNSSNIFCQSVVDNITTKKTFTTNPFSSNFQSTGLPDIPQQQQHLQRSDVLYFSNNKPSSGEVEIDKTKIVGQKSNEENFFQFLQEKFPNKSLNDITEMLSNFQMDTKAKKPENYIKLAQSNKTFIASTCNLVKPVVSHPHHGTNDKINGNCHFLYKNLYNSIEPVRSLTNFNIPRHPLYCPCTDCQHKLVMVSDFIKHLKIDHLRLTFKYIEPGNCIEIFLKAKYELLNINKCHSVLLVMNKIT